MNDLSTERGYKAEQLIIFCNTNRFRIHVSRKVFKFLLISDTHPFPAHHQQPSDAAR